MYFSLNDEHFILSFNPCPYLRISGPSEHYLVELKEFQDEDDLPVHLEGYKVSTNFDNAWRKDFLVPIEFYLDCEFIVYKFIDGYGLRRIYNHRYCDYGKLVLFNLVTDDRDECELWVSRVLEYQKKNQCNITIKSKFDDIDKKFQSFYYTEGIDYYKTYNIGRFPKTSTDFKTVEPRKEGLVWYGNYKTFWSYQHPRNWKNLSSQEIVDDILGL